MAHDGLLRAAAFVLSAVILAGWEVVSPRRAPEPGRMKRWIGNLGVVVIATALIRLAVPVLPALWAATMRNAGHGLFPLLDLAPAAEIVLAVLILDLAVYFQHRAFHAWWPLWRLHRMHHADTFIDFSTGVRFHPLEILLSVVYKLLLITVLAPPALAVLVFEIILNCTAMFNHANIFLPPRTDRIVRAVLVTPDMHRVHHSTTPAEMNTNFGFSFPWWDRLFATYTAQPEAGHADMTIGLRIFREPRFRSLFWLLALPFIRAPKTDRS